MGDHYCGRSMGGSGHFRDAHAKIEGPAVRDLIEAFNDSFDEAHYEDAEFSGGRSRRSVSHLSTNLTDRPTLNKSILVRSQGRFLRSHRMDRWHSDFSIKSRLRIANVSWVSRLQVIYNKFEKKFNRFASRIRFNVSHVAERYLKGPKMVWQSWITILQSRMTALCSQMASAQSALRSQAIEFRSRLTSSRSRASAIRSRMMARMRASRSALQSRASMFRSRMSKLRSRVSEEFRSRVSEELRSRVSGRMSGFLSRMSGLRSRISGVRSRMSGLRSRFVARSQKIVGSRFRSRMTDFRSRFQSRMTVLQSQMTALRSNFTAMHRSKLAVMKTRVTDLQTKIRNMRDDVIARTRGDMADYDLWFENEDLLSTIDVRRMSLANIATKYPPLAPALSSPIWLHAPRSFDCFTQVHMSNPFGESKQTAGVIAKVHQMTFSDAIDRIQITTPYFSPTVNIRKTLIGAARRGVSISIITSGHVCQVPWARYAAYHKYEDFLRENIRIYEMKSQLHAKTLSIDGVYASVGSFNFDRMSLINLEVNLSTIDPDIAHEMETQFQIDLQDCQEINMETIMMRTLSERCLHWFCHRMALIISPNAGVFPIWFDRTVLTIFKAFGIRDNQKSNIQVPPDLIKFRSRRRWTPPPVNGDDLVLWRRKRNLRAIRTTLRILTETPGSNVLKVQEYTRKYREARDAIRQQKREATIESRRRKLEE